MTLTLPRSYVAEMVQHALEDDPIECCGIIAGARGVAKRLYRAINKEDSPYRYNVEGNDLFRIIKDIEKNDWDVLAIYHSHTHTHAYPSPTDVRLARGYPDAHYVLVSLADAANPRVRSFRITDGQVHRERLRITEDDLETRMNLHRAAKQPAGDLS